VSLFRRREPLHERLAREGGLIEPPLHEATVPRWGEVGIHGVARPREWDVVATVEADLQGERAAFVVLPDRTIVVEEGPDKLEPLAEAVERDLDPPYRAEAVKRAEQLWAVAARRIELISLPDRPGDELELTVRDGSHTLVVDGEPEFGTVPALESLIQGDGVVRARRIDGAEWEIRVDRL
jgi:hypothetical protein